MQWSERCQRNNSSPATTNHTRSFNRTVSTIWILYTATGKRRWYIQPTVFSCRGSILHRHRQNGDDIVPSFISKLAQVYQVYSTPEYVVPELYPNPLFLSNFLSFVPDKTRRNPIPQHVWDISNYDGKAVPQDPKKRNKNTDFPSIWGQQLNRCLPPILTLNVRSSRGQINWRRATPLIILINGFSTQLAPQNFHNRDSIFWY